MPAHLGTRSGAAIGAAIMLAMAASPGVAETKLVFNKFIPATHPYQVQIMDVWAKDVATATNGRVKIEFTGSSLAPPPRQFDLVSGGGVDLAFSFVGYNSDRFVRHGILTLPMLGLSAKATTGAYWKLRAKHFQATDEFRGVKLMAIWANMPGYLFTSKKVRTVADYAGLKTRVGDRVLSETVKSLGAVPVFSPAPTIYEMLSRGVLNAAAFPASDVLSFKAEKFVPHAVLVPGGIFSGSFYIAMNPKKWESLPAEDRAAIEKISGETLALKAAVAVDRMEAEAMPKMRASGADLWTPDEAFMKDAKARFAQVEAAWIKQATGPGFDAAAVLAELRRLAAQ
ncbi:MAG: TRAP transporter substrate-binding protein [Rhodospirillaceae bacterium]|nr:TRAP transporter substrate-binding protein [Rhodospirillaceae bacterium]